LVIVSAIEKLIRAGRALAEFQVVGGIKSFKDRTGHPKVNGPKIGWENG